MTKYNQHTPGPFLIEQNDTEGIYLVNAAGTILCEWVHTPADANLLAAAPELLAALVLLMPELDSSYNGYDKARAAIAKARGKA